MWKQPLIHRGSDSPWRRQQLHQRPMPKCCMHLLYRPTSMTTRRGHGSERRPGALPSRLGEERLPSPVGWCRSARVPTVAAIGGVGQGHHGWGGTPPLDEGEGPSPSLREAAPSCTHRRCSRGRRRTLQWGGCDNLSGHPAAWGRDPAALCRAASWMGSAPSSWCGRPATGMDGGAAGWEWKPPAGVGWDGRVRCSGGGW